MVSTKTTGGSSVLMSSFEAVVPFEMVAPSTELCDCNVAVIETELSVTGSRVVRSVKVVSVSSKVDEGELSEETAMACGVVLSGKSVGKEDANDSKGKSFVSLQTPSTMISFN